MAETTTINKPVKIYKGGLLSVSVWEKHQENGKIHSFTFQRSYKDNKGEWQNTESLNRDDLPKLKVLLSEAYKDYLLRE